MEKTGMLEEIQVLPLAGNGVVDAA